MRRFIPVLLLGLGAWVVLRHYRQQNRLSRQLAQLTAVLDVENNRVTKEAQNTIAGIETAVAKNHNQPADIALLRRAEALQVSVTKLTNALRSYGSRPRHPISFNISGWLRQLRMITSEQPPDDGALRRQIMRQQVAAYADTLRQLGLMQADTPALATPTFSETAPAAETLADLKQLESEVLARQTFALQRLVQSLGKRSWLTHPLITAAAASNVVAPGDTYRAQLGLVRYFSAAELKIVMACNGRPVLAGPDGTGLVRFRAPARPGPATWTGTIRLNQNGRDMTFKVVVPYRVARH